MLDSWYNLHNIEPSNSHEVLEEFIWNNEQIKINDQPILLRKWFNNCILKVKHIISSNKTFYTKNELELKHKHSCDIMTYNSIKSAIRKKWLTLLKEGSVASKIDLDDLCILIDSKRSTIEDITHKKIYWNEVHKKSKKPTSYEYWERNYLTGTQYLKYHTLAAEKHLYKVCSTKL